MKKLLILVIILLASCSKEEQEKINALKVNPPDWIVGIWNPSNDSSNLPTLRFTEKVFYKANKNENEINFLAPFVILMGLTGEKVALEEYYGTNQYIIEIKTEISGDTSYEFTKISNQEISWDNAPPLNQSELYKRKIE